MTKYRLLVIDDDQDLSDLISSIAHEELYHVRASADFLDIARLYDEFLPHVIILDIIMPDMDGFEVLNFLRERHSTSRIVIMSAKENYRAMALKMAEGLRLEITRTMAKPFAIDELRQVLQQTKQAIPIAGEGNFSEAVA